MTALGSPIKCKAIINNVNVGAFYDHHQTKIVMMPHGKMSKTKMLNSPNCNFIHNETIEINNLLQLIGFDDDARINIFLDLVPNTGLVSVIDYPFEITEHTRFLHYTYTRKRQYLNRRKILKQLAHSSRAPNNTTHLITEVTWGVELFVVLRLPQNEEIIEEIDIVLEKLSSNLNRITFKRKFIDLNEHDKNILHQIINTEVYSNIPSLSKMKTIDEIYQNIRMLQKNNSDHQPIGFVLYPIHSTSSINNSSNDTSDSSNKILKKNIEKHLIHLRQSIKHVKSVSSSPSLTPQCEYLQQQHNVYIRMCTDVLKQCETEIERWKKLMEDWHKNAISVFHIQQALHDQQLQTFRQNLDQLKDELERLHVKEELISNLQQNHFKYYNVSKEDVNVLDDVPKFVQKLIQDDQNIRVLCSSDQLNKDQSVKFQQNRDRLIDEYHSNSNLHLVYADFSSCAFQLSKIDVLTKETINEFTSATSTGNESNDEYVNILLLGESGVGKSTFINAFVNYLRFKSMKDAELNKPEVIIPVSFLITTGDNFDEHIIKFGDFEKNSNEDFDHPGQSVTQRCQFYEFNRRDHHGKKLRIIDTPGFGDTRGLNQDDRNMQHVFEYLTQFSHLNTICFLLKPNVSRLTNFFRTSILEILEYLNPNIRRNIVFCFTNARTTFYSPGDTGPLLRSMLNSLPSKDIPFGKANTFCFDNEAFRYLVALRNGVVFNELDREEYEKSWSISVNESNRMIEYICENLRMCYIGKKWESLQNTQGKILSMVDSMLEAIRNIFRLMISLQTIPDEQKSANGLPGRTFSNNSTYQSMKRMKSQVETLSDACLEFAQFLINTNHSTKPNDPFFIRLTQMVDQQQKIYASNISEVCSKELFHRLNEQKENYVWKMNKFAPNLNDINLSAIEERIKVIQKIVEEQKPMNIIKDNKNNIDLNRNITRL